MALGGDGGVGLYGIDGFSFFSFFSYNKGLRRGISRLPGFVEENSSHWAILHVLDIRFL